MKYTAIAAGYLCLDIIPQIYPESSGKGFAYVPGKLEEIGSTAFAPGGAAANTGLALNKLGIKTGLSGRIGSDPFGLILKNILSGYGADNYFIREDGNHATGHTFILNPPGQDRMFMVHSGANDFFCAEDLPSVSMDGITLLHFGYPPLLKKSYRNLGEDTKELFKSARNSGVITSLDMSLPDPASEAGAVDWPQWLKNVLPEVDIFLPSLEEIMFMLDGKMAEDLSCNSRMVDADMLFRLSGKLIDMGVAIVCIKMGSNGIYLRTSSDLSRLSGIVEKPESWRNIELIAPCFEAEVKGTTGAGDCTIAGFLSGVLKGFEPALTASFACAAGSSNVEAADSLSGLMDDDALLRRIKDGWKICPGRLDFAKWRLTGDNIFVRKQL